MQSHVNVDVFDQFSPNLMQLIMFSDTHATVRVESMLINQVHP